MNPDSWLELDALFAHAVELPAGEREAYLESVDPGLRAQLQELLASDADAHETVVSAMAEGHQLLESSANSRFFGPYRVTSTLGQGGMGAVYRAVRDDRLFEKEVAIKVVRLGLETPDALARFRQERKILAGLEHTGIARLLDGGETEESQPWIAMEFVEGKNLLDYARDRSLPTKARLLLFLKVCDAVQYAHGQFIVHRDLKPANILITEAGEPKLLDFGIARVTSQDTARTATGMQIMTPDYASPEQVRGERAGPASDVYSLGAILYELLAGGKAHVFQTMSALEVARSICERDPERPSRVAPASVRRQLQGDLDNIVLMALDKNPGRRYASVDAFSADIQRHLEGRPVFAHRDSPGYRTGKFVRRHWIAVTAAALVTVSLSVGLAVSIVEKRQAERRFQQVRKLANAFLFDFDAKIARVPGTTGARELLVTTALEYLDSLARDAAGDSGLQIELAQAYEKVGDVQGFPGYPNLGRPLQAEASYEHALHLAQHASGNDPVRQQELIRCWYRLGRLQALNGKREKALDSIGHGLQLARDRVRQPKPTLKDYLNVVSAYSRMGEVQVDLGDPEAAITSYESCLEAEREAARKEPGKARDEDFVLIRERLGLARSLMGDLTGALSDTRAALTTAEEQLAREPHDSAKQQTVATILQNLGDIYYSVQRPSLGQLEPALTAHRKSLELARAQMQADAKNVYARMDVATNSLRVAWLLAGRDAKAALELANQATTLATGAPTGDSRRASLLAEAASVKALALREPAGLQSDWSAAVAFRLLSEFAGQRRDWKGAHEYAGRAIELAEAQWRGHEKDIAQAFLLASALHVAAINPMDRSRVAELHQRELSIVQRWAATHAGRKPFTVNGAPFV